MKVGGCTQCGLVQLMESVDPNEFYADHATPSLWKNEPHVERSLAYFERKSDEARVGLFFC
jgi:hypothetical protein